ncbi:DNRLRE domain-containing protein [bacterium]|nr:DNRLRE domain-containing protein [bacterium]
MTIAGSHFSNVTEIAFNSTKAPTFTIDSDSQLRVRVPLAATNGPITVTNTAGSESTATDFELSEVGGSLTVKLTDDAFVYSKNPRKNYGAASELRVRTTSSAKAVSLLKFKVVGLSSSIKKATLHLRVIDDGADGGDVFVASNTYDGSSSSWNEETVIWNNAPKIGKKMGSIGSVNVGGNVKINVTSAIDGDGTYSFAVRGGNSDVVMFDTKEGKHAPELIITLDDPIPSSIPPTISSFVPETGVGGQQVTIFGSGFTTVSQVIFAESQASFTVDSDSQIRATIPEKAKTGRIRVVNRASSVISNDAFIVKNPLEIASFEPQSGVVGTEVSVTGSGFTKLTDVKFNGISVASVTVESDHQVRMAVPTGATTGKLTLETADEVAQTSEDFVVIIQPFILSFSPESGTSASEITITGLNFAEMTSLTFNDVPATEFNIASETEIRAIVPGGATTGPIRVTGTNGMGISSTNFRVLQPPQISSFNPGSGPIGSKVTISGQHFNGTTKVLFNDVPVESFSVKSDSKIVAEVPEAAATGRIRIVNAAGEASSATDFTVIMTPQILSFTPTVGTAGTEVTITGFNFTDASNVSFNGLSAMSYFVDSDRELRAVVPESATTGLLSITTLNGVGTSSDDFAVTVPSEVVVELTNDTFVHSKNSNKNYGSATELRVRKTASAKMVPFLKFSVSGLSEPPLKAVLKLHVSDASDDGGSLYAVSNNYKGTKKAWTENKMVWTNAPEVDGKPIDSVGRVKVGQTVKFNVTKVITGNGVFSFAIQNDSDDAVRYDPKEGLNPPELIIEVDDSLPVPAITSFQPTIGAVGTEVTISGSNLNGATKVHFGATQAQDFITDSDKRIRATVPSGAETGKISVTTLSGRATSAKNFDLVTQPAIVSFSPASGSVGTEVTLAGTGFTGLTQISFHGIVASHFNVESDTKARVRVPLPATTGLIRAVNLAGSSVSSTEFEIVESPINQLSFTPTDDSFIRSTKQTKNYGDDDELRARNSSSIYVSYLKFNVSGLTGPVQNAVLRLYVINGSNEGGEIFSVSNNYEDSSKPWKEDGLIWRNAPEVSGASLSSLQAVGTGQRVEFDITTAISGEGIFSFAIASGSSDVAKYSSKEGSVAPELIITFGSNGNSVAKKSDQQATTHRTDEGSLAQPNGLLPESLTIQSNYPNPFNASTTIAYGLPESGRVVISVYNLKGQEVKRLVDSSQTAGFKKILWNGKNESDVDVASGIYIVRLTFSDTRLSRMITLQK